jgi:cell division protein FtsZ
VVATGLNRSSATRQTPRAASVTPPVETRVRQRPVMLRTGTGNEVADYAAPVAAATETTVRNDTAPAKQEPAMEYLDIPAFLRRQAD